MEESGLIMDNIKSLIVSYLTNNISGHELHQLQQWIEASPDNRRFFNDLKDSWMISGRINKPVKDPEPFWQDFNKKLDSTEENITANKLGRPKVYGLLRMAASWVVFFLLGISVMFLVKSGRTNLSYRPVSISVPLGAISNMVLPDGTKVWLNAGTELIYNEDYGIKTRTLQLTGEAYFDVAKDKNHPFIVNVGEIKIKALGTKFNVKAYPEEKSVLTTLEEGKIDVQYITAGKKVRDVILLPNENLLIQKSDLNSAFLNPDKRAVTIDKSCAATDMGHKSVPEFKIMKNVNIEYYTSWKDERWIIAGEPLETLVPVFERRYGVKIAFQDEVLKDFNFTGTIQKETIEQIMTALKWTAPVNFKINKDSITLFLDTTMNEEFNNITKTRN